MLNTDLAPDGYDMIAALYAGKRDQASSLPYLERLADKLPADSLIF